MFQKVDRYLSQIVVINSMFINRYLQIKQLWLLTVFTTILYLALFLFQTESCLIYSHLNFTQKSYKIIIPITINNINYYKNTYGAERTGNRHHQGIDIFATIFTPVLSVSNGMVLKTGSDILGGILLKFLVRITESIIMLIFIVILNIKQVTKSNKEKRLVTLGTLVMQSLLLLICILR